MQAQAKPIHSPSCRRQSSTPPSYQYGNYDNAFGRAYDRPAAPTKPYTTEGIIHRPQSTELLFSAKTWRCVPEIASTPLHQDGQDAADTQLRPSLFHKHDGGVLAALPKQKITETVRVASADEQVQRRAIRGVHFPIQTDNRVDCGFIITGTIHFITRSSMFEALPDAALYRCPNLRS
ncbi:hypothetical protein IF1G_01715 [Cordyceps javanica]|uniref:Uncharacterized protein n=1 Tax=Cordyceps javanica TaxID=43265 RepID=A0A545VCR6_9HYPO|nr:hypothetical protein IF1G_01715 [Cordyceps javanica]